MSETNPNFAAQSEKLVRTLTTMFDYLGLNGDLHIEEADGKMAVKITSEDAGRIIGRRGQTLESLQLLANRMMFKEDENFPLVTLDIDGYAAGDRERHRSGDEHSERGERPERSERRSRGNRGNENSVGAEQLEQQARDAAKEVKRWGEPVKMPEMNAHDRRIIHLTLENDPDVTTSSEGEGAYKKVVVSLRKTE
ncbi:MAG: KH domain-containing protein [Victivallaceae bacterium]|nr:KH domain-containing protein [Victivallaceae bacterium]